MASKNTKDTSTHPKPQKEHDSKERREELEKVRQMLPFQSLIDSSRDSNTMRATRKIDAPQEDSVDGITPERKFLASLCKRLYFSLTNNDTSLKDLLYNILDDLFTFFNLDK